jgi:AcrR family transcriptional regulator
MAHPKQLDPAEILATAVGLLEEVGSDALSLRAIATRLGVKAPSLYHHFADKAKLEQAIIGEGHRLMLESLRRAGRDTADPEQSFRAVALAYLRFARKRPALYFFTMGYVSMGHVSMGHDLPEADSSEAGKALWNLLLERVGALSGNPDDTSGAVAAWAFLHGFAVLEHSGRFGKSGPREGLERGLESLISQSRRMAQIIIATTPGLKSEV